MTPTAETPRSPEAVPHQTVPMLVWADIDVGIADMVRYLNTIPGVRTEASCQGGTSYRPQVLTIWPKEQEARLLAEFDIHETNRGECWGYLHPRDGWVAPLAREAPKAVAWLFETGGILRVCRLEPENRHAVDAFPVYRDAYASPATAGVDTAGDLLAVVHRDGGHYEARHGRAKAVKDAIALVYEMRALAEGTK